MRTAHAPPHSPLWPLPGSRRPDPAEALRALALPAARALLSRLDRDPDSPTAGSFDPRGESPASVTAAGILALAAIERGTLPLTVVRRSAQWLDRAIGAVAATSLRDGAIDPRPLHAALTVLTPADASAPRALPWRALARRVTALATRSPLPSPIDEAHRIVTLVRALRLPPLLLDEWVASRASSATAALLRRQSPEGWFPESGACDAEAGLRLLDPLTELAALSEDPELEGAIDSLLRFLTSIPTRDARLPASAHRQARPLHGIVGLVRLAQTHPVATWLLEGNLPDLDLAPAPETTASLLSALPHLTGLVPPIPPRLPAETWWPEAGLWVVRPQGRVWEAIVHGNDGGVVELRRPGGEPRTALGWRLRQGGRSWETTHRAGGWELKKEEGRLTVRGCATPRSQPRTRVGRLVARIARCLPRESPPEVERRIELDSCGVVISDRLPPLQGGSADGMPGATPEARALAGTTPPRLSLDEGARPTIAWQGEADPREETLL